MIDRNSQFMAILTNVGAAKLANANALGIPWNLTELGVGDANGTDPMPSATQTKLINEQRRAPLNQLRVDPVNAAVIVAEQVIPADVGGWWIREIGLYDSDGDLVAVSNCAPSFKPALDQGSGRTQIVRMNFIVSSINNIVLKIDPAIVLATREYVDLAVTEAINKQDFKHSVLVATTANTALTGIQTIDGVLLSADTRVLVKNQAQAKDNGIYLVPANGAWKRAQDADTSIEVTPGLFVHVEKGTANGDSVWQLVTDAPIVLGTTPLMFEVVAGRTGIVAGTYRSLTVDKLGRVIAGTNPTTLDAAGITDAMRIGAGGLMTSAPMVAGAISDLPTTQFFAAAEGNTTDIPASMNFAVGLHIKYPGPAGAYCLDIVSSVTAEDFRIRYTGAGGPAAYRVLWHSGNFNPSDYMPKAGGAYAPSFYSLRIDQNASVVNLRGGYINYGAGDGGLSNAVGFICNRDTGAGGFSWRSVNADNTVSGPIMTYTYDGILKVPTALSVPAITSNTTVSTQTPGYAGGYIANCAFVSTAVSSRVFGDRCPVAGFAGGGYNAPYMSHTDGTIIYLRPASMVDTALLAPTGWSKNADTGEINQWIEYVVGDTGGTTVVSVTWPFKFPNQCLNVRPSLRLAAGAQSALGVSLSGQSETGCLVRIEEWAAVIQTGLVLMVEARGF